MTSFADITRAQLIAAKKNKSLAEDDYNHELNKPYHDAVITALTQLEASKSNIVAAASAPFKSARYDENNVEFSVNVNSKNHESLVKVLELRLKQSDYNCYIKSSSFGGNCSGLQSSYVVIGLGPKPAASG